ncbi:MAG: hypothetical protein QW331_01470 [Candidatus Woesearchaeota archaeon]
MFRNPALAASRQRSSQGTYSFHSIQSANQSEDRTISSVLENVLENTIRDAERRERAIRKVTVRSGLGQTVQQLTSSKWGRKRQMTVVKQGNLYIADFGAHVSGVIELCADKEATILAYCKQRHIRDIVEIEVHQRQDEKYGILVHDRGVVRPEGKGDINHVYAVIDRYVEKYGASSEVSLNIYCPDSKKAAILEAYAAASRGRPFLHIVGGDLHRHIVFIGDPRSGLFDYSDHFSAEVWGLAKSMLRELPDMRVRVVNEIPHWKRFIELPYLMFSRRK